MDLQLSRIFSEPQVILKMWQNDDQV